MGKSRARLPKILVLTVGVMTTTRVAATRLGRYSSRSSTGSMNAAVLPEPVTACGNRFWGGFQPPFLLP